MRKPVHRHGHIKEVKFPIKKEVKLLAVRCLAPHGDVRTKLQSPNTYWRLDPLLVTRNSL